MSIGDAPLKNAANVPHGLKVHGIGWYIGFCEMQGGVRGLLAQVLPFTGEEIKRTW